MGAGVCGKQSLIGNEIREDKYARWSSLAVTVSPREDKVS